jgi:hypothetical protein
MPYLNQHPEPPMLKAHFFHRICLFALFLLVIQSCQNKALVSGAPQIVSKPPTWQGSMQDLKKSMTGLQPFIFDRKKFALKKNEKELTKEIHTLSQTAKNVKHDPTILSKDPTVRFVAAQFADELQRADENFSTGWKEYSRSQLVKVTGYCIECHTRLHSGPEFSTKETESYMRKLSALDQIEFKLAFRQYDAAFAQSLLILKNVKFDNDVTSSLGEIARLGLLIAVQFKQDKSKAILLTTVIDSNTYLPLYLKESNQFWIKSLDAWNPDLKIQSLGEVRKVILNRKSEVEDMRAISSLLTILTDDLDSETLGQALLLTGESYETLNQISILSLHQNYYESCVRRVPKSKAAPICFAKLKNSVTLDYSGSAGTHLPKEIQQHLDELKKVME